MKKFAIALAVVVSLGVFVGTASADHRSYYRSHSHRQHNCYPSRPVVRYYEPPPCYRPVVPVYRYDPCHDRRGRVDVILPGISFSYRR
jgi:hypothetical protein